MGTVKKKYSIDASSEKVFQALTEEAAIASWSGDDATMNLEAGGKFSLWGGSIHGENLKISKAQIIQHWKEEKWTDFSKVTFNIEDKGDKSEVELIHENIPENSIKSINNGWDEYYMLPLKAYSENK